MRDLLAASCLLFAAGCGAVPYVEGEPLDDAALRKSLAVEANSLYPESFRTLHRVVLTVRGRQFDFTGYVLVKRPSALRVVAFSELGGTLFDVVARSGAEASVLKRPPGMRPEWLAEGVAETVRMLYFSAPGPRARLTARDASTAALVYGGAHGGVEEMTFDRKRRRLAGLVRADGRRCLWRIRYLAFAKFEGWAREVPQRIVVDDLVRRFRLEITVLGLTPGELPAGYFSTGR